MAPLPEPPSASPGLPPEAPQAPPSPPPPAGRAKLRARTLLLLLLAAPLLYNALLFAHVLLYVRVNPRATAFMERELAKLRAKDPAASLRHAWVPYERISANLKRAIVASEDSGFVDHEGFEWEEIAEAFEKNLKKGRIVAGGSTITQQLAKNLFLSPDKTPWRKAQEALVTLMLEAAMDKRRILEIYLNVIEWGEGVFGAEAAARHYYKVSSADLTAPQAAWLASMITAPRRYEKDRSSRRLLRKARIIRGRMGGAEIP